MRISDWSSDVCSSDLRLLCLVAPHAGAWIETLWCPDASTRARRPSCRGVDRNLLCYEGADGGGESPLMLGRGSKLTDPCRLTRLKLSPLMQGRGPNLQGEIERASCRERDCQ